MEEIIHSFIHAWLIIEVLTALVMQRRKQDGRLSKNDTKGSGQSLS